MDWILHGDMGSCGKIFVGEGGEGVVEDAAEKKNLGNGGGEGEEEESASKSSVEEPRNLNESDTVHRELLLHMWTSEDVANWLISVGEEEVFIFILFIFVNYSSFFLVVLLSPLPCTKSFFFFYSFYSLPLSTSSTSSSLFLFPILFRFFVN